MINQYMKTQLLQDTKKQKSGPPKGLNQYPTGGYQHLDGLDICINLRYCKLQENLEGPHSPQKDT